ncbi:MAG: OmpL47-type beta-barrel domain-containing protein, partial [Planctomycetaceae bacterium]
PAGIGESSPLPAISSDKADYAPGETVTLSGNYWAAGEAVHVVVNDDAGQTWRYETDVTAGPDGAFSLQFNLPEWFVAVYTATASAPSGTATTSFTDANLKFALATTDNAAPSTVTWSVNWDQWQGTGQNPNNTCTGTRSNFGTANYSGNTLSSGSEAGINNNASAKPTSAQTTGAFAGTYELDYWSASPGSTTPLTAAQLCQAGVNGPTVFTFYAHFKLADATPPTTTASASPAANAAGWNKSNVTVDLSAADNAGGSGVKEITYSASGAQTIASTTVAGSSVSGISITAEGTTTLSFFAEDNAGNTEATKTLVLKIDKTAPVISCGSADGLWHASNVDIPCTANDATSGLLNAGDASFNLSTNVTDGVETDNASTGTRLVKDKADNESTAGPVAGNKVDRKAPQLVSCESPDGNWHAGNVTLKCTYSDGG